MPVRLFELKVNQYPLQTVQVQEMQSDREILIGQRASIIVDVQMTACSCACMIMCLSVFGVYLAWDVYLVRLSDHHVLAVL